MPKAVFDSATLVSAFLSPGGLSNTLLQQASGGVFLLFLYFVFVDMSDYRYIPIKGGGMKTYLFRVEFEEEEDGLWSAWIHALPGCAAWGYTKEEALNAIQDAAEAYLDDMIEAGEEVPPKEGVTVIDAPVVTITRGV